MNDASVMAKLACWVYVMMVFTLMMPPCQAAGKSTGKPRQQSLKIRERPHPFLLGGMELYKNAKEKARTQPWADKALQAIVQAADLALLEKLDIPDRGGQWTHHYICRACGNRLQFDGKNHNCMNKKCGKSYQGWPYDDVLVGEKHEHWLRNNLLNLALAYQLMGQEKYAVKARHILLEYAKKYKTFPKHTKSANEDAPGCARLSAQTLDEAVLMLPVSQAWDLVCMSECFSKEDRRQIETDFLLEAATVIGAYKAGYHNWQTWHNAAILSIGLCLQRQDLVDQSLDDPNNGILMQLRASVTKDGFWYEGSMSYHYYALHALTKSALLCRFAGLDLFKNESLRNMYLAPLEYADMDGIMPATGDGTEFDIKHSGDSYALAYAMMLEDHLLTVARIESTPDLLLWGLDQIENRRLVKPQSRNFPGLGVAILRKPHGIGESYVHLDYNSPDAGHGHLDKLSVIFKDSGHWQGVDAGRTSYASPFQNEWYRHTLAHNTVVVDQSSSDWQAKGRLDHMEDTPRFTMASVSCDNAYAGVAMKRTLLLTPKNIVIDVFDLSSSIEHDYDWVWHNPGEISSPRVFKDSGVFLGTKDGYEHIRDIRECKIDESLVMNFQQQNARLQIMMGGEVGSKAYSAKGLMGYEPRDCNMLLVRRKAKSTTFVAIWTTSQQYVLESVKGEKLGQDIRVTVGIQGNPKEEHHLTGVLLDR